MARTSRSDQTMRQEEYEKGVFLEMVQALEVGRYASVRVSPAFGQRCLSVRTNVEMREAQVEDSVTVWHLCEGIA